MTHETVYICIPTTPERKERLQKCIDSIHLNAGFPHVICTYENQKEGFIKPIHRILAGLRDDALVWCIGDDSCLTQPDTLKRLVAGYSAQFPANDGVVNPDDGIQHGQLLTMPLCSALTMRKYTYKGYFLNYADNEFTEVMVGLKKYFYMQDVFVDHQHWVNGKAKKDATYEHAMTKFEADRSLFIIRKRNNFEPKNV